MDAKISVEVGAKIDELTSKMVQAEKSVANFADKSGKKLDQYAKSGGQSLKAFSVGSNQAAFALTNLGRVAQDAPFGFIGIQNNLNPLLESFTQLRKESGSNAGALKLLGQSLIGPAGLGLALSVVTAGLTFYTMWQQRAGKATAETTKTVEQEREEFSKTPYERAYKNLQELTTNVKLAKDGFLNKNAVLKQYNEGIGQTIGKVTSLDQAEQSLVKNGDAYLRLMLLKANAEFAFKKAAEESYNLSLKQDEIDRKKPQISSKFDINADRSKKDVEEGLTKPLKSYLETTNQVSRSLDGVNTKITQVSKNLGEQIIDEGQLTGLKKTSDKAVEIANSAQQKVIEYAKKNGFNLNGLFDIKELKAPKIEIPNFDRKALSNYFGEAETSLKNFIETYRQVESDLNKASGVKKVATDAQLFELYLKDANTTLSDFLRNFTETEGKLNKTPILPVEKFQIESAKIKSELDLLKEDLDKMAESAINGSFANFASAIGSALANGDNAFEAGGKALLGSFGEFLAEYGKLLIKYGAAAVLKGKLDVAALIPGAGIPAGVAAIAAGVALVAAGAAVAAFAGGGTSGSSSKSSPTRRIPGFASGVDNFRGGVALVGERGPELVNLPKGSDVIPNHQLGGIMGGGAQVFIADTILEGNNIRIVYNRATALANRNGS